MAFKIKPSLSITGLPNATICDFWSWAYSDLVSNTIRPLFAEYLVGECLELTERPRVQWDSIDFRYRNRAIEVKSAGYVQTWIQRAPSVISFDIAAKAAPWDATNNLILHGGRSADIYVLCVHTDRSRDSCCVHDSTKWDFYVLSKKQIGDFFGTQKTIRLSRLVGHCFPIKYGDLRRTIDATIDNLESATATLRQMHKNMQRISSSCIYTIADPKKWENSVAKRMQCILDERRVWVSGRALLAQANLANEVMPVLLGNACDCSEILFWGFLTNIDIDKDRRGTRFTVDRLRRLLQPHTPQELTLQRTGNKIAPHFIKPYAICLTPDFLRDDYHRELTELALKSAAPLSD